MNLIIDQGNTKAKIAVFKNDKIIVKFETEKPDIGFIEDLANKYDIENVILSSVKEIEEEVKEKLKHNFSFFLTLDNKTALPFKVNYQTKHTLGADRIAAIAGADAENGKGAKIVIDAGTAITYDFMDSERVFQGGNIAPGLRLRFMSLNQFTGALPLVDIEGEYPFIGKSTETAIRCGVVDGVVFEIEGFINNIKKHYSNVFVFLTGGDAKFLSEKVKYPIFVDKNLVLKGLNRILNYNVEK